MEWQDINTAPQSTLVLAWFEGSDSHSGHSWRRSGYHLAVFHDGRIATNWLRRAAEAIIGPQFVDAGDWNLAPTHWAPLPEPPND